MHPLEENFRILRVRVAEICANGPAVVVVGSAQPSDGSAYVACGLARAFSSAGRTTLLLDANPIAGPIAEELDIAPLTPARDGQLMDRRVAARDLDVAALHADDSLATDDEIDTILANARGAYDVTVVDASAIPGSSAALRLAWRSDGVLVTVRLGRRPGEADDELRRLLAPTRVLGIVPTRVSPLRAMTRPISAPIAAAIGRLTSRLQAAVR